MVIVVGAAVPVRIPEFCTQEQSAKKSMSIGDSAVVVARAVMSRRLL
jgi:hypothetical protein